MWSVLSRWLLATVFPLAAQSSFALERYAFVGNQNSVFKISEIDKEVRSHKAKIAFDIRWTPGKAGTPAFLGVRDFNVLLFDFLPGQGIRDKEQSKESTGQGVAGFVVDRKKVSRLEFNPKTGDYEASIPLRRYLQGINLSERRSAKAEVADFSYQSATLQLRISLDADIATLRTKDRRSQKIVLSGSILVDPLDKILKSYWIFIPFIKMEMTIANLETVSVVRDLCVIPISIQGSPDDPEPTGNATMSLDAQLPSAREIWGLRGEESASVRFSVRDWETIELPALKILHVSSSLDESSLFESQFTEYMNNACVELVFIEQFAPNACHGGGGFTMNSFTERAHVFMSDERIETGNNAQLLAHELGHVMGIHHPDYPVHNASPGTVMCASGCEEKNPSLNSRYNMDYISSALFTFDTAPITPVAPCHHDDCGSCP